MRDQRDLVEKQRTDIDAPFRASQALLEGTPPDEVLRALVMQLVEAFGAVSGSLSLIRHNGELQPVVLHGLQREPLVSMADESQRPLGMPLAEGEKSLVFMMGDPGPLAQVLERDKPRRAACLSSDGKLTAIIAIPSERPINSSGS